MDAIASDRSDAIESIGWTRCPLTQYWPTWVTIRRCYRIWQVFAKYLSCNRTHGRWVGRPWNFLCFKVHRIERPSTLDLDKTSSRVSTAFTNIFCIVVLIRSMLLIKLLTYRYRSDIDQPISFQATCWRNLFNDRLNILQENSNSFFYECRTFWWSIPTFLHCAQEPFRTLTKIIQDTYRLRLKTNNINPTTPLPVKHVGAHCCPEVDGPESDG